MATTSVATGFSGAGLHVFLTGRPGVGKTTAVRRAVDLLMTSSKDTGSGLDIDGFYTEERRERGKRTGFDVVTVDGQRKSLADIIPKEPDPSRRRPRHVVGQYAVNVAQFESIALPVMRKCIEKSSSTQQVVIVDEVGKMEAFSPEFLRSVQALLENSSGTRVLGTIPLEGRSYPAPLNAVLQAIHAHPQCMVVEVTERNRRDIPQKIVGLLLGSTK